MSIVDYLLDGLKAELELERELGIRSVECNLDQLKPSPVDTPPVQISPPPKRAPAASQVSRQFDFVFLHHCALTAEGNEMMSKIITALGKTADTAPIIITSPIPKAKITVVLGGRALQKFFPDLHAGPGQWIKSSSGENLLVTYSPSYILRFTEVTPAVMKYKKDMWLSLKSMIQRLHQL